jgi:hypothetical protein
MIEHEWTRRTLIHLLQTSTAVVADLIALNYPKDEHSTQLGKFMDIGDEVYEAIEGQKPPTPRDTAQQLILSAPCNPLLALQPIAQAMLHKSISYCVTLANYAAGEDDAKFNRITTAFVELLMYDLAPRVGGTPVLTVEQQVTFLAQGRRLLGKGPAAFKDKAEQAKWN